MPTPSLRELLPSAKLESLAALCKQPTISAGPPLALMEGIHILREYLYTQCTENWNVDLGGRALTAASFRFEELYISILTFNPTDADRWYQPYEQGTGQFSVFLDGTGKVSGYIQMVNGCGSLVDYAGKPIRARSRSNTVTAAGPGVP